VDEEAPPENFLRFLRSCEKIDLMDPIGRIDERRDYFQWK
jgi:hypothetical protein